MVKDTHTEGGITAFYVAVIPVTFEVLKFNLSPVEFFVLFLMVMVLIKLGTVIGAYMCDFDHQNFNSIPLKSLFTYKLNRFLVKRGVTHRSWHLHNLDVNAILFLLPGFILLQLSKMTFGTSMSMVYFLAYALLFSFFVGIVSHIILDMFTKSGSHMFVIRDYKYKRKFEKQYKNVCNLDWFKVTIMPEEMNFYRRKGLRLIKYKPFEEYNRTGGDYEEWFRGKLWKYNNRIRRVVAVMGVIGFIKSFALHYILQLI